jgi:hypothetical protein
LFQSQDFLRENLVHTSFGASALAFSKPEAIVFLSFGLLGVEIFKAKQADNKTGGNSSEPCCSLRLAFGDPLGLPG